MTNPLLQSLPKGFTPKQIILMKKKSWRREKEFVYSCGSFKTKLSEHVTFITVYAFHTEEKKNPQKANKQIVSRFKRRQLLRIRMACLCLDFHLFLSFVIYIKCISYLSLVKSSPGFCFFHINVLFPCINPLDIWNYSLF